MECYTTYIGSYRRFGRTYRPVLIDDWVQDRVTSTKVWYIIFDAKLDVTKNEKKQGMRNENRYSVDPERKTRFRGAGCLHLESCQCIHSQRISPHVWNRKFQCRSRKSASGLFHESDRFSLHRSAPFRRPQTKISNNSADIVILFCTNLLYIMLHYVILYFIIL